MNRRLQQLLMELRAGRVLSSANEKRLRDAVDALNQVLSQLGIEEDSRAGALNLEHRYLPVDSLEIRQAEDGHEIIAGHAAVFNQLSVPLWGFRERIRPGAFAASLASGRDIRGLWQHDASNVLGRTKNKTLRLWEDSSGLAIEIDPPDTVVGRDAVTLIGRGDVDQMSFGFEVLPNGDEWTDDEHEGVIRDLVNVELWEVSPVTWAAYPQTDVGIALRSAPEWVQRALTQDGDNHNEADDKTRARLNLLRRELDLLELEF